MIYKTLFIYIYVCVCVCVWCVCVCGVCGVCVCVCVCVVCVCVCVCIDLFTQNEKRMLRIILPSMACLFVTNFTKLSHKRKDFR